MSKEILLILIFHLVLVCGAPLTGSSSKSRSHPWVFWYYSSNGNRSCGNYCYLVFSLVGAILLCICGCGCLRCYYTRKHYKSEDLKNNDKDTELAELEHNLQKIEQQRNNQFNTQQRLQYPPLVYAHDTRYNSLNNVRDDDDDNSPPPSYINNTHELHKHALRQESNWSAYKAGSQFTSDNSPTEILPPQEHLAHIKELGGVEAWKFIPESSILKFNIASVTNHILSFHAKLDATMQTNYPLHDMEYSKLPSDNIPSINKVNNRKSIKSNNLTNSSLPPPLPSYTPQSFYLQPPTDSWFYYYEIIILSNPNSDKTTIAIGLATKPYPIFRLPGCNLHSVGYHSEEGRKLHNEGLTGSKYAEKWGEVGDVIGCGYYPNTGQVFFTKNGKNLGIAYTGLHHIWFPTVGADGVCSLEANFGQNEFKYREANGMSVAGYFSINEWFGHGQREND